MIESLRDRLAAYGSDLSRWPDSSAEAREALIRDPDFRRAYERERELDVRLAAHRDALDTEITRGGALDRVRRGVLRRRPSDLLAGIPWRRVAAAVVVASIVGGALDLALPDQAPDSFDVAFVDPLLDLDGADGQ